MRRRAIVVLAMAVPGGAAAETLKQALNAAYKFNPRLDAARALQRATDEEVPRALSGYRPSVAGSADTTYERTKTTSTILGTNREESNPRGYAVGLTQPIFRGFRTKNAVSLAEATVRAGWEGLRTTESSVLLEAVTAYLDVVRDQAILTLRENNVTVLTRDLAIAGALDEVVERQGQELGALEPVGGAEGLVGEVTPAVTTLVPLDLVGRGEAGEEPSANPGPRSACGGMESAARVGAEGGHGGRGRRDHAFHRHASSGPPAIIRAQGKA